MNKPEEDPRHVAGPVVDWQQTQTPVNKTKQNKEKIK